MSSRVGGRPADDQDAAVILRLSCLLVKCEKPGDTSSVTHGRIGSELPAKKNIHASKVGSPPMICASLHFSIDTVIRFTDLGIKCFSEKTSNRLRDCRSST